MPEFLRLLQPDEARSLLLSNIPVGPLGSETLQSASGFARVTAADVLAPHALPQFMRSSVDGYAVRARDTFGASDSMPAYLKVVGEIQMGATASMRLDQGECTVIHTGGMLPDGADAVVMVENTQEATQSGQAGATLGRTSREAVGVEVEVLKATAIGENVISVGEDVVEGELVIPRGTRLGPAEVGGLMALGVTSLRVAKRPRIALMSTGDEVVDPHSQPALGQVRDVNAHALAALVAEHGGEPLLRGVVRDDITLIKGVAREALEASDALLISGGSSAGARDATAEVIQSLGKPGVLVHGINIRPGKPTILGACAGKAVVGLPGNPVSALVIGYLFVVPLLEHLLGRKPAGARSTLRARLQTNLASQAGREDWWPVKLHRPTDEPSEWQADPLLEVEPDIQPRCRRWSVAHPAGVHRDDRGRDGGSSSDIVCDAFCARDGGRR
jgi:molybdopterin molybdotransferase